MAEIAIGDVARMSGVTARTLRHDERFRATYDRVAPGVAEYVRDAMAVHAGERLA